MGLYHALHPHHSRQYYGIVHGAIFVASTAVMGLMGWIMSPPTQGQLTGGDDATGNLPGLVFLMAFFPWIYSACTVALWLVDEPIPPLVRAAVQTLILLPANIIVGFFLGWENNWKVFLGSCTLGSILCKSVWKKLVRVEGVCVMLIGLMSILTIVDIIAALRIYRIQRVSRKVDEKKTPESGSDN